MPISHHGTCGMFSPNDIVGVSKESIIGNLKKN